MDVTCSQMNLFYKTIFVYVNMSFEAVFSLTLAITALLDTLTRLPILSVLAISIL